MTPEESSVAVPDEPQGPRDSARPFVVVLAALGVLGGAIFLLALLTANPRPASDREDAVRKAVHALVTAASRGDGAAFRSHFDSERMLAESVGVGVLTDADGVSPEAIGAGMAELCARGAGTDRQWRSVRVGRVSFRQGGAVADAFARVRRGTGISRLHFLLAPSSGRWKVFDWESMEEALRISSFVPSLLSEGEAEAASTEGVRAVVSGIRGAMMLAAGGEFEKAIDVLGKMKAASPSTPFHPSILRLEAEYFLHVGKPDSALRAAIHGMEMDNASPMLILYQAEALSDLGRHEESLRASEAFLLRMGDDPEALNLAGLALRELGHEDEAAERFRKGILMDPEDYRNRYGLGVHLLRKGKAAEGADALIEACRYAPSRLGYFESAAPELAGAKAYAPLLELAVDQAGRTPSDTHVAFYRGFALRRLGRAKEAEEAFREGLNLPDQGDRLGLRSELALVLSEAGRGPEAHELMEQVEREDAAWGDYLHACLEAQAGHPAEASRRLKSVLALDPTYHRDVEWEPILEPLARTEEMRALLADATARADFQEKIGAALEGEAWEALLAAADRRLRDARDPDALYYRGVALRHLGRFADARGTFLEGMQAVDEGMRPAYWEELSIVLARMGNAEEAHAYADRLLRNERFEATGLHARAVVFAIVGKGDDAVRALSTLLGRYPIWRARVESEPALADLRRRSDVQDLLRKAADRGR